MEKAKVAIVDRVVDAPTSAKAVVDEVREGAVTSADKLKFYYKWLISAVSVVLAILVENQDLVSSLFGASSEANGWVAAAILVIGNAGVFLKENEKWVNKLPGTTVFPTTQNQ